MPAQCWRALLLATFLLLLQAGGEPLQLALRLDAAALAQGQWWRLLTAHLVHLGWVHALMNAAGVLLCVALAPRLFNRALPVRLAALALGISLGLWQLFPHTLPYVGLSGVLYGLIVLGLVPAACARERYAAASLLIIAAWLAWQWRVGTPLAEEQLLGGRVVHQAHLIGCALALLWLAFVATAKRWRGRRAAPPRA